MAVFWVFGGHCMDYYNKRRAVADDLNWMTLNSHFVPYTVTFRVESFTVDALVLKHDCFKIHREAHILSAAKICCPRSVVSGNISLADIRRGSQLRWCQMRVRSSKMRLLCRSIATSSVWSSPLALHIEIYTAHTVSQRQHGALVVGLSIVAVHSSTAHDDCTAYL